MNVIIKQWQRISLWVAFLVVLAALLLRQESAITQDLGRHLRLGEMIVSGSEQRRCALFTNCLTYTYPDYPFINHHWGSEVLFYLIHKIGGLPLLIIFKAVILGATFVITVMQSVRKVTSDKPSPRARGEGLQVTSLAISMAIIFFSIQMIADRLVTRPEIFGYLLFSLLFFILKKNYLDSKLRSTIYIVPAVILLWVNLHISFVFGLILVWLWAGSKILNTEFRILNDKPGNVKPSAIQNSVFPGPSRPRAGRIRYLKLLAIPVISTLVTILNPSGLRGALMPLSIMKDYGYTIVENMTPFFLQAFKPQPEYWIYSGLIMTTVILLLTSKQKPSLFHLLIFVLFSIFPLLAVRHLPFFALTIPVILAPLVLPAVPFRKLPLIITGGLFVLALSNPVPLAYANLPPLKLVADPRHSQAVEFVKRSNLEGRMWNNYDIGSFLELAVPNHQTFVDGRPEAFPPGFFKEVYIPMQETRESWDNVVGQYNIQWVFAALSDATPWFQRWWRMIQIHSGWRIVYVDDATAILVRRDGPNRDISPITSP